MRTPFEYRSCARALIQKRWREVVQTSAIIMALSMVCTLPSSISYLQKFQISSSPWITSIYIAITFLPIFIIPIQYALHIALLNRTRESEANILQDTWQQTETHYLRLFIVGLLTTLITTLVGIVTLGIGAIVLSYAYRMVPYLLHDYPELSAHKALKISREMMKGYKRKLFVLDLSFIGWLLACLFTLGLATLFVIPWMHTSSALFYEDLKAKTIVEKVD